MGKRLFKTTAVISCMTLISRLSGFLRDMLVARIFGVDLTTDAFYVAFKIPNLLRRLLSEGAFGHAIIPNMMGYNERGDTDALKQFIGKTAGTLAAWAAIITVSAMILAPLLIGLLAPGFSWQGEQFDLAVDILRITLPFGFFIALVAYAGAVLNAHDKFVVPALAPVFLNVCMITATLWLAPLMDVPITALAWGVAAAGVVQLLFQIPSLVRLGLLPSLSVHFTDPDVRLVLNRLLPSIFSASVTQINVLVDTLIASFLVSGSVSWLYYSDRLVEFPLGILGIGLGAVILPNLTNHHASDNTKAFSATLDWGLRLALLLGLPATIGLTLLAEPILSTLFLYDEFTTYDVYKSGQSLKAYGVGLLGYLASKILMSGFTSRHDLKTPVRYGTYSMGISLVLNVALVFPLAHAGLALATSMGALFNAVILLKKLLKDRAYQPGLGWLMFLFRITLASVLMAACLYYFVDTSWWRHWEAKERMINLLKWVSISCLVYVLTLFVSGLRPSHFSVTNDKIVHL